MKKNVVKGNIRVIIEGPQGSGKTWLARAILGLLEFSGTRRVKVYSTSDIIYTSPAGLHEERP